MSKMTQKKAHGPVISTSAVVMTLSYSLLNTIGGCGWYASRKKIDV